MEIPCLCLRHKEALHPSVTQVVNTPNVPIAHAFQFGPFVRIPFSALGLHGGQKANFTQLRYTEAQRGFIPSATLASETPEQCPAFPDSRVFESGSSLLDTMQCSVHACMRCCILQNHVSMHLCMTVQVLFLVRERDRVRAT